MRKLHHFKEIVTVLQLYYILILGYPVPGQLTPSKLAPRTTRPIQTRPTTTRPTVISPHRQLTPWTIRPMNNSPQGQLAPWTARPMENSPLGQRAPRQYSSPIVGFGLILYLKKCELLKFEKSTWRCLQRLEMCICRRIHRRLQKCFGRELVVPEESLMNN